MKLRNALIVIKKVAEWVVVAAATLLSANFLNS